MRATKTPRLPGLLGRLAAIVATAAVQAVDPCEQQKLTPAAPVALDQFGDSVAVSGDVAVVGASRHDLLGSASGIAYVFRFDGLFWVQEAELFAFSSDLQVDGAPNDLFGWSVAVDAFAAAGPVIVVGAYLDDDDSAADSGSAYVFRWTGAAWGPERKLRAFDAAAADEFGEAVGVEDDLIVVGAGRVDDGARSNTGAAYVFRHTGTFWDGGTRLTAADAAAEDRFGLAVAVDAGGPGGDLVVVGAPLRDGAGSNRGAAYVFVHDGVAWDGGVALGAPGGGVDGDKLGEAVAVDGDLVLAGAPFNDDGGSNAGLAYVFRGAGGLWEDVVTLAAADPGPGDQYGAAVSVCTDPDGLGDVCLVGAPLAAAAGSGSGAAYAHRFVGFWEQQAKLVATDGAANDRFGIAVTAEAAGFFVGASQDDDDAGLNAGSAYLFTTGVAPCTDCDGDGLFDHLEIAAAPDLDCNGDSVLDVCEIDVDSDAPGGPFHCTDACDPDCNDNGVPDACDIADGTSSDIDANDVPDECEDCNGNGLPDGFEIAQGDAADCNMNGLPDECDIADGLEEDCDGDGVPDACAIAADPDLDLDGDGVLDACQDCDGNGFPDFIEIVLDPGLDCDESGVLDVCEIDADGGAPGGPYFCTADCDPDCNANGVPDACDVADGTSADVNGNGVPDECEDCNGNGALDDDDIDDGTSLDCNANGVPDECEIDADSPAPGGPFFCAEACDPDCNDNGIPDACDVADATSEDCDANGVPDECEDCDGSGVGDACEIAADPLLDLDGNGVLDVCDPDCDDDGIADFLELILGTAEDCNDNGVPDACDIADGTSPDDDGDGVPDECAVSCATDLDATGAVDFQDLLLLLLAWGTCDGCAEDVNGDGAVDFQDLLLVLLEWGPCP
jgi:hypothetical protein